MRSPRVSSFPGEDEHDEQSSNSKTSVVNWSLKLRREGIHLIGIGEVLAE